MDIDIKEFDREIEKIDINKLKIYLKNLKKPCFESELLKIIFDGINIMSLDSLTLFRYHFILFHILYILQEEFYRENLYLHIHFMRIFLTPYPEKGRCRYYDEYNGVFCNIEANESDYCDFHFKIIGNNKLEKSPIKLYYLDKSNYFKLNKKSADDLINGAWNVLNHYDQYKESFKILDLPESSDLTIIKKRYKYLAKKYHPDSMDKDQKLDKSFNEINRAYRFLISILEKGSE